MVINCCLLEFGTFKLRLDYLIQTIMLDYNNSKYIGFDKEEDITELENLSNLFVVISEYHKDKNILEIGRTYVPFFSILIDIIIIVLTLISVYHIVFTDWNMTNFGIEESFIPKLVVLGSFIIGITIGIYRRLANSKFTNKLVINFEKKLLTFVNLDFVGKYFYENVDYDFYEIKAFRIREVKSSDKFYSRNRRSILVIETKDEKEYPLLILGAVRLFNFNQKRFTDLLNSILRV